MVIANTARIMQRDKRTTQRDERRSQAAHCDANITPCIRTRETLRIATPRQHHQVPRITSDMCCHPPKRIATHFTHSITTLSETNLLHSCETRHDSPLRSPIGFLCSLDPRLFRLFPSLSQFLANHSPFFAPSHLIPSVLHLRLHRYSLNIKPFFFDTVWSCPFSREFA